MPPRSVRLPRVRRPPSAVRCFAKEGSWSFSFAGAGFLGLYHVGVTQCLKDRAPRILYGARCYYGSSSGALNAVSIISGKSAGFGCDHLLGLQKQMEQLSLGVFHPGFMPLERIHQDMRDSLPDNVHILANKRLGISLTRWHDRQNVIVTEFASRDEVIQAIVCSVFFPLYCGLIPPEFKGERYIDGALSNNLPFSHCPGTITVSPFPGDVDICPEKSLTSVVDVETLNKTLQTYALDFFRGVTSLIPSSPEVVADSCRQGYLDALRFLERHGVTKEPVLWTLVCEEPVDAGEGSLDASDDRDKEEEMTIDRAVPRVLVQDVPDFKQLSPELEAALQKACKRDPRPWAQFWRSETGMMLSYLLLPLTLPFEFIYYRSKRMWMWLPQAATDFKWMYSVLIGVVQHLCSRIWMQLPQLLSSSSPAPFQQGQLDLKPDLQASLLSRLGHTRLVSQ